MSRFVDKYLSPRIQGWPVEIGPVTSTQIAQVDSGSEQTNQRWRDPLRGISIPQGFREFSTVEALKRHWLVMAGPARTWPWRDPTDFASVDLTEPNVEPFVSRMDQRIGTGDGVTKRFELSKTYNLGSPAEPYTRRIYLPVVDSVVVGINGADPATLSPANVPTITRYGGYVDFPTAPGMGAVITAGFLFDIIVRFESDDTFRGIMRTAGVGGFADIPLREVRFCED